MRIKITNIEVLDYNTFKCVKSIRTNNETKKFFRNKAERGFNGEKNEYFEDFKIVIPEVAKIGTIIEFNKFLDIPEKKIAIPVHFKGISNTAWINVEIV